jgi:hypothetical protein
MVRFEIAFSCERLLAGGDCQGELQNIRQTLRFTSKAGCRNLVQNEIVG